ncbi:MAG: trans-aconitate methyltransferase [Paracoccaceae bacterium]|nr:MAG: class I SAM-dependent methyltransferase [Alphaproteobacteria bacterium]GIX12699.1 MAG: trans-aconitate methyltransferase [Paracoccaceae bacterium]
MSFSADWLALREPADRAARDPGLVAELAAWLAGRPARVTDLGCGTGASWRALAPALPPGTQWLMVDADPALLDRARRAAAGRPGLGFLRADLAEALETVLARPADIVTATALIDLASRDWLTRLGQAVPAGAAVYVALSYDGQESWTPPHPAEARALAAFHRHMRRNKGLGSGPALGPEAGAALAGMLAARGWRVRVAQSPWRLGPRDAALIAALADGAAAAVAETGALDPATLGHWHAARRAAREVRVGHCDILALPPG